MDFDRLIESVEFPDFQKEEQIAVAVSGGPDSMALTRVLSGWTERRKGPEIHALTVDHGLRPESGKEAQQVGSWISKWPRIRHHILRIPEGTLSGSRIQEQARKLRYELMEEYCRTHGIAYLFLAHHQDDQAETFIFRLSKGSGIDGLACMQPVQKRGIITLIRPFLEIPKGDLTTYCKAQGVPFIKDPSNRAEMYARARLRKIMPYLEKEGLSASRLGRTAKRAARARRALDFYMREAYKNTLKENNSKRIVLYKDKLLTYPDETIFRTLKTIFEEIGKDDYFGPRMEKIEALLDDLVQSAPFRKRTLGGVTIEKDDSNGTVLFVKEVKKKTGKREN